MQHFLLLKYDA